jgi:hypothetical protein
MEFIESERGNQKLNIKQKKNCGGQLSCSPFICSVGEIVCILITINKLLDIFFFTFQHFFNTYFSKNCLVLKNWGMGGYCPRPNKRQLLYKFSLKMSKKNKNVTMKMNNYLSKTTSH